MEQGALAPPPLPTGLPVPADDGAAEHLPGRRVPDLVLPSTEGRGVNLAGLARGSLVLYAFPKMGRPGAADPPGWDEIPGARGCTQQSCAFRDHQRAFSELGHAVAGLSAQPTEDQQAAARRFHLTFPLLADPGLLARDSLGLPTFEVAGMTLYRRLTLVARGGRIVKVFYPVFPPDQNAEEVLSWVRSGGERSE